MNETTEGAGWILFAGIILLLIGTLNVIWGIAAIDSATFFVEGDRYIISDLSTWGWIMLIVGGLQLVAAFSIWAGGVYGRWLGIITACVGAVGALLTIPGFPLWSIAIFGVSLLVIYGLAAYGGQRTPV